MLNQYIINNTLWYLINSYNYTNDTGDFQYNPKKIERLSVGNILEYTIMYFLEMANIHFETDKHNPFTIDNGIDILVNGNIPLHCKGSSSLSLIGQVRNGQGIISDLKKYRGYIIIAYINYYLVQDIKNLIERYLNNGGSFANNKNIIDIDTILSIIGEIDYNNILNNNYWDKNINIKGLISVEDYFNNSYLVKYGEQIPGTNFTQNFKEGSYFLNKDFKEFISIKTLLK